MCSSLQEHVPWIKPIKGGALFNRFHSNFHRTSWPMESKKRHHLCRETQFWRRKNVGRLSWTIVSLRLCRIWIQRNWKILFMSAIIWQQLFKWRLMKVYIAPFILVCSRVCYVFAYFYFDFTFLSQKVRKK